MPSFKNYMAQRRYAEKPPLFIEICIMYLLWEVELTFDGVDTIFCHVCIRTAV